MDEILTMCIVGVLVIVPFALLALDVVFFVKQKEKPVFEICAFSVGGLYMTLAYWLWDLPDYQKALNVYGTSDVHEPFSTEYMIALVMFAVWGFASYLLLKFLRKKLPPLVEVFLLAGIYVGIFLSLAVIVQLICGANPIPAKMGDLYPNAENPEALYRLGPDLYDWFMIFCLCTIPVIYLAHAVHALVRVVKEKAERQREMVYGNPVLQKLNTWLLKGANLFWVAIIALLPVLGILIALLLVFGQQPDSIIKVFTQTSDWILSEQISPPPVAYDTHYLCTVSLRGHRKLVKPVRYGVRRGEKIVVNRQLCVANAFEQLLEEKTPHLHKKIRRFYDTYGYPISRHINTAFAADVIYLMMKPLEWVFVFVLYLMDPEPENRINSQYMPKGWRQQQQAEG